MTCIELFDRNFADNVCSCLALSPDRVILLGKEKSIFKHAERYTEIFKARGYNIEFKPMTLDRNDMSKIIDTLSSLVEQYDDCTFDLTGGDDQYLVAVGIILERYKGRVQGHCINTRNGEMTDCDCDGKVSGKINTPSLSFEENVKLYGGKIKNVPSLKKWKIDSDFLCDLDKMWHICLNNNTNWNIQTAYLNAVAMSSFSDDGLEIQCSMKKIRTFESNSSSNEKFDINFVKKLYDAEVITNYVYDKKQLCFRFKNDQVKQCLTKAGQVLELKVYATAKLLTEHGAPFYNDAKTGVIIEWDDNEKRNDDVLNEIDVVLMKGMIPVFISCKNGRFDSNELFKLESVTKQFGGKYAKKIVITTSKEHAEAMRPRATELKIGIVYVSANMSNEKFEKKLKSLWSNNG